jgi:acetolactate synthase I/II/III large subunit
MCLQMLAWEGRVTLTEPDQPCSSNKRPIAAEVFLRRLREHGVEKMFLNPGTDFPPLIEAYLTLGKLGSSAPTPVLVPHENTAVTMAHGYFLATGRPQAVMVHVSVGTANTINAIADASRDNIPILLCAGRSPITEKGLPGSRNRPIHWAQEMFDQAGMVREWVKWDYELREPSQVADVVDRAIEVMTASPQRPVYLTLPREPLAAEVEPGIALDCKRDCPTLPHPSPTDVNQLADWILAAQSPLVVVAGLGRKHEDVERLAAIADRYALPVVCPSQRFVCLPTDHPMHAGFDAGHYVGEADFILVIECDAPWLPNLVSPRRNAKVVHVGEDPAWLRHPIRNFPSSLAITSDAGTLLVALESALVERAPTQANEVRQRRLAHRNRREIRLKSLAAKSSQPVAIISPEFLSRIIGQELPEAVIVNEYPLRPDYCARTKTGTYYALGPAGGLGWSFGAALGIKAADPSQFVVATMGDGSYMFANPSACHWASDVHRLPILTVIFNNGRYGAVRNSTLSMYADGLAGRDNGRFLADLNSSARWHQVVEAHGGYGERVSDPAELAGAIRRARRAVELEGRQALLDVICPY